MSDSSLQLSVIICTQNRADSLRVTLECLASGDREGIRVEVIVVDNASCDHTQDVVAAFGERISIRYLYEPIPGKSYALNRALDTGRYGEIVAVLDDDMSPDANWFQGVMAICRRWPDGDLFSGETFIIWPATDDAIWANCPRIHSWIFSATSPGVFDQRLGDGRWFLGGHFWFRSRVLDGGRRFRKMWLTEPDFQLDLAELGFWGVAGPDARAGHRIQRALCQESLVLDRAKTTGTAYAELRLIPFRRSVKQARLMAKHPLLGRIFCLGAYLTWCLLHLVWASSVTRDRGFERRVVAVERMATYKGLFWAANRSDHYAIWRGPGQVRRAKGLPSS